MRRYWLESPKIHEDHIEITGELFKHIFIVCRQQEGHRFELLVGDNTALYVEVVEVLSKGATLRVIDTREVSPLKRPFIHLVLSLPKWNKVDLIVEKAVELGVHTLHPCVSDFSFVRQESKVPESKVARWNKIALSATQQCGRGEPMRLEAVTTLEQTLESINPTEGRVGLFPYEGECEMTLSSALKPLHQQDVEQIWLFVGSEGGFSEKEVALFASHGLQPVTMGAQILRVETACLALVSVIKYEMNLME